MESERKPAVISGIDEAAGNYYIKRMEGNISIRKFWGSSRLFFFVDIVVVMGCSMHISCFVFIWRHAKRQYTNERLYFIYVRVELVLIEKIYVTSQIFVQSNGQEKQLRSSFPDTFLHSGHLYQWIPSVLCSRFSDSWTRLSSCVLSSVICVLVHLYIF